MAVEKVRAYWVQILERLARPVLTNLAGGKLMARMPLAGDPCRRKYASLEVTGRLLNGLAPWLELEPTGLEAKLNKEFRDLARQALTIGLDQASPDRFNFTGPDQPLVDAAFLAQALLRAPTELWGKLNPRVQADLIAGLQKTRAIQPYFCNWLLFSAIIEAALFRMGVGYDPMRVDYALRQLEDWYLGDGTYSDGPEFHWDYYNSFVIQPMLLDLVATFRAERADLESLFPLVRQRAERQAVILERLIAPDGSFPPIGRSLTYRMGAFHLLAQLAWRDQLPAELTPAQVRCGLSAVMKRTMEAPGTFDENGWLTIGLAGRQPVLGESYITNASVYLCSTALLPLGLPSSHPFWLAPPAPYTSLRIWSGEKDVLPDQALAGPRWPMG
jgi:hypothetical protein